MTQVPFQLRYELNRRQRLVPHLVIWLPYLPGTLIVLGAATFPVVYGSLWLLPLLIVPLWMLSGFVFGCIDVIVRPVKQMDIIVEENGLGFLAGSERWWIFLDGVIKIGRIDEHTWTVFHFNGTVINIPVWAITEVQVAHLVSAMKRRHTPEGIQT
jgi:hypothetical protein